MSRTAWARLRVAGGVAILGLVVWRLGTGPVLDGLRTVNLAALGGAAGITLVTTVAAAWRWSVIAERLGVGLPMGTAIAAYYRAQFLNTALPGGVLGDAHRAIRHGQDAGDVGRGVRAVVWERGAGQAVQVALALVAVAVLPSPVRPALILVFGVLGLAGLVVAALASVARARPSSRVALVARTAAADLRDGVLARRAWPRIVGASVVVVAGHTTVFLIAARTAGVSAATTELVPLAMLVLLAMALPVNVGGWGPREGVAAWLFGSAGLGAGPGVSAATVFGVLVLVSSLPGAVVLVLARRRDRDRTAPPAAHPAPALMDAGRG